MYEKIKLDYNSLEPFVDDETLGLHYNKHYGKYLDNLNRLLKENNYKFTSLYDLIENIDKINLNDNDKTKDSNEWNIFSKISKNIKSRASGI